MSARAILPPSTIGIIGGGQLGMMIVREAQRMGYHTCVWDPDPLCPAGRLADTLFTAPYGDHPVMEQFAAAGDVITYEFEHIDVATVRALEQRKPLFPRSDILAISGHRAAEKRELAARGFPVAPYAEARSAGDVKQAIAELRLPVVAKTATAGYDGKGQTVIRTMDDAETFIAMVEAQPGEFVIERFIELEREISVVAVRSRNGEIAAFPTGENDHRENILHITRVPARITPAMEAQATTLARRVMEEFNVVGVLCVEMFVTAEGAVIINELAPRPHNSGHYTLDACTVSQFEAVVRAVCALPMSTPRLLAPCAMINLLGKHLSRLDWDVLLREDGVKVHLYGKTRVEPKRKMGHITIVKERPEEVERVLEMIEGMIGG